ncbi:MAG: hypothetical protein ABI430_04265 [Candidatus Taylorbacteria bacterium]
MEPRKQAERLTKFTIYAFVAFILVLTILVITGATTFQKASPLVLIGLVLLIIVWALFIPLISKSSRQELDTQTKILTDYGRLRTFITWLLLPVALIFVYRSSGLKMTVIVGVILIIGWLIAKIIRKKLT